MSLPNETDWVPLSFDTSALGVRTALLKGTIEVSQLRSIMDACATQGLDLLYWTPDVDVAVEVQEKEWFTGYAMTKGVEFRLPLASEPGGSAPLIPKEMNPDFIVEALASPEQEDFYDLVDLALVAGQHSRYRHDPALTHAQFKSLYTAWLRNSVARQVADQIFVARRKEDSKVSGFITVKLAIDKGSASVGLLGVSPSCRRQGLGGALMSAACGFAKTAGVPHITVRTQANNC
jgi:GNAT superfamily N-acetyltransferase